MTTRTAPGAGTRGVADSLVIFGATGDLARKKLHPALHRLSAGGHLSVPVVGVARSAWTDDQLRTFALDAVRARYGAVPQPDLDAFADRLSYVSGDAWRSFTHDDARRRAYRWNEDGLLGISDDGQRLCLALCL